MTEPRTPSTLSAPAPAGPPVRGRILIVALILFAVLVFTAAGLAWAGVAVIIALMVGAYTVLIRWSR